MIGDAEERGVKEGRRERGCRKGYIGPSNGVQLWVITVRVIQPYRVALPVFHGPRP